MDMTRTFVAVEAPAAVRQRAVDLIERLRASQAEVKWVEPHNLHVTVKFLGDVPTPATVEVCAAVAAAVQTLPPLPVTFRGAGAFPDMRRPTTVWLGIGQGADEFGDLVAAVEKSLAQLGYPKEGRRFHPHLTLGRVRGTGPAVRELSDLIRAHAEFEAGTAELREVVVFASHLNRTGPTYQALARIPLAGS